jgi:hypothetical protein
MTNSRSGPIAPRGRPPEFGRNRADGRPHGEGDQTQGYDHPDPMDTETFWEYDHDGTRDGHYTHIE